MAPPSHPWTKCSSILTPAPPSTPSPMDCTSVIYPYQASSITCHRTGCLTYSFESSYLISSDQKPRTTSCLALNTPSGALNFWLSEASGIDSLSGLFWRFLDGSWYPCCYGRNSHMSSSASALKNQDLPGPVFANSSSADHSKKVWVVVWCGMV